MRESLSSFTSVILAVRNKPSCRGATALGIQINSEFPYDLISVDTALEPIGVHDLDWISSVDANVDSKRIPLSGTEREARKSNLH